MSNFWLDIIANLLSELILWLLLLIGGVIWISKYIFGHHMQLRRFFGLTHDSDLLTVYFSSIPPSTDGAINRYGKRHTMNQPSVLIVELDATHWVKATFDTDRLDQLPDVIKNSLGKFWAFRPIHVDIKPSPLTEDGLMLGNATVVIGGAFFNSVAKYIQEHKLPAGYFEFQDLDDGTRRTEIRRRLQNGFESVATSSDTVDIGVIQKFQVESSTIIWAAGARTNGTKAAVYFLLNHWHELSKQYKDKGFAVYLKCPANKVDPDGYRHPISVMHAQL